MATEAWRKASGPEPIPGCPIPGTHIWGWMRIPELEWLAEQAAQMESVVEIGSLHGRSAFALLTACEGPVYCIDPWDDERDLCYSSFLGYCGHFPNLHAISGLSPAVAGQVPTVDMVFIDGDHEYDSVIADIDAWLPKARKLICGHDYTWDRHSGYPGVKRAVDEKFGDRVTIAPDTAIWAVEL
jgi:hypothetical protein